MFIRGHKKDYIKKGRESLFQKYKLVKCLKNGLVRICLTNFEEILLISNNSHWEKFSPMRINEKGEPGYVYKSNTPNTKRAICLFICFFIWLSFCMKTSDTP